MRCNTSKNSGQLNGCLLCKFVVKNKYGIHARPAAMLVKVALVFESDITIQNGDIKVSGKSIMGLMTLEACYGAEVTVSAEGADAMQAIAEIQKLFDRKFDEE